MNENLLEFIGQIICVFEDFLDNKGIVIPNPERDDESDASIYGDDYFNLESGIYDVLEKWGVLEEKEVLA